MKKINILNVDIDNITEKELLENLKRGVLVTPNVDDLIKNQHDNVFHANFIKATYTVCDSKILLLAARFLGCSFKEIIPGSGFFSAFYMYHANDDQIKIFLLGAKEGVGEKAMKNINSRVNRQIVVGAYSPPFGFENDEGECDKIVQILKNTSANVVVVGLGNPKQTKWIFKYKDKLPNINLFLGLGATIDFEAGNIQRAPLIMQQLGLEWCYRLLKEPKRLWKRYLVDDMAFFYYLFLQKIGKYKNPFEGIEDKSNTL